MRFFFLLLAVIGCSDGAQQPGDAGVPDLPGVDLPAPGPGRTCEQAIDLTQETQPYAASTEGGISQTDTTCDDTTGDNPELYFRYDVGPDPIDLIVDVVVDPMVPWDAVITSRSDCASADSETFCADNGASQHLEVLGATGVVSLVVDGTSFYGGAVKGAFTIAAHKRPLVNAGCDPEGVKNRCDGETLCRGGTCVATSAAIECAGAPDLTADLADGYTEVTGFMLPFEPGYYLGSCSFLQDPAFPERVYTFTVTQPSTLDVNASDPAGTDFDTLLYLTKGSCDGPEAGCNDDIDYNNGMFRSHLVTTLGPGVYFLFIDAASPAIYGAFDREPRHYQLDVSLLPVSTDGGTD